MANTGVEFHHVHVEGGVTVQGVTVSGATAEELVEELERRGLLAGAELAGLQRRTIIALAQRLKPAERLDFEQAVTELERAVEVALDVIARGERGTNDDAFLDAVLARVAELVRSDDLDGGAHTIDAALAEIEAGYRRSQTTLLEEGIKVDTLRRDAAAVARRIELLVAVDHPTDRPAWLPEFRERHETFRLDGETRGINFSLSVAIELARRMFDTARHGGERGISASLLGNALLTLGQRESGPQRLEDAVGAYRAALQQLTRERMPLLCATTQNNLGNALAALGERERGTARLEGAVEAYRAALTEQTRERAPLDWARTQDTLGNVLTSLDERESGTQQLEKAVVAYRMALQERTRERVPLDWAMTQVNLGNALTRLGERANDTARLEEAVAVYRAAVEELTRERVPLRWAVTQDNLGNALRALGECESGTARFEEAVAAFRSALEERTRENRPLDWAITQNNLGNTLRAIGERESDPAPLEEAFVTLKGALEIFIAVKADYYISVAEHNLARTAALLEQRRRKLA